MNNFFDRLFQDHPALVGETYAQHLVSASKFGVRMIFGGIACFLHAVFPFMCVKTGSEVVVGLHAAMVEHRMDTSLGDHSQMVVRRPE